MSMNTRRLLSVIIPIVAIFAFQRPAPGDVIWTGDRTEWETLAGDFTTIGFNDLPSQTWVTEQYAHLGAHFVDGLDLVLYGPATYPRDGFGLDGFGEIHVVFDMPLTSIALDFPGAVQFELYSGAQLIYISPEFGGSGVGFFVGLVSTDTFDKVVLTDQGMTPTVAIDDLHFGPPIPAPPVMALLALAAWRSPRRRRT